MMQEEYLLILTASVTARIRIKDIVYIEQLTRKLTIEEIKRRH